MIQTLFRVFWTLRCLMCLWDVVRGVLQYVLKTRFVAFFFRFRGLQRVAAQYTQLYTQCMTDEGPTPFETSKELIDLV